MISDVSQEWEPSDKSGTTRAKTTPIDVYELKGTDEFNAKLATIFQKIESFLTKRGELASKPFVEQACSICDTLGRLTSDYPTILAFREVLNTDVNTVMAIGKSNCYKDHYNPNWGSSPNDQIHL